MLCSSYSSNVLTRILSPFSRYFDVHNGCRHINFGERQAQGSGRPPLLGPGEVVRPAQSLESLASLESTSSGVPPALAPKDERHAYSASSQGSSNPWAISALVPDGGLSTSPVESEMLRGSPSSTPTPVLVPRGYMYTNNSEKAMQQGSAIINPPPHHAFKSNRTTHISEFNLDWCIHATEPVVLEGSASSPPPPVHANFMKPVPEVPLNSAIASSQFPAVFPRDDTKSARAVCEGSAWSPPPAKLFLLATPSTLDKPFHTRESWASAMAASMASPSDGSPVLFTKKKGKKNEKKKSGKADSEGSKAGDRFHPYLAGQGNSSTEKCQRVTLVSEGRKEDEEESKCRPEEGGGGASQEPREYCALGEKEEPEEAGNEVTRVSSSDEEPTKTMQKETSDEEEKNVTQSKSCDSYPIKGQKEGVSRQTWDHPSSDKEEAEGDSPVPGCESPREGKGSPTGPSLQARMEEYDREMDEFEAFLNTRR